MSDLAGLFLALESSVFDAEANVASGHRIFKRFLRDASDVKALIQALRLHPGDAIPTVCQRIHACGAFEPGDYAHRYDATLAAYYWALREAAPDVAYLVRWYLAAVPGLFWTRHLIGEDEDD